MNGRTWLLPGEHAEGEDAEDFGVEVAAEKGEAADVEVDDIGGEGAEVEGEDEDDCGWDPAPAQVAVGLCQHHDGSDEHDGIVGPGDGCEGGCGDEGEQGTDGGAAGLAGGPAFEGGGRPSAVQQDAGDGAQEGECGRAEADEMREGEHGEALDLRGGIEVAHAPCGEGLVVLRDEKHLRDAVQVCEVVAEERLACREHGRNQQHGGPGGHACHCLPAFAQEPIEHQDCGCDFDGGGACEQKAGETGALSLREHEAEERQQDEEHVCLHERHGVLEGLREPDGEYDDADGKRVEEVWRPEPGDEADDPGEAEHGESGEDLFKEGEVRSSAEGLQSVSPEGCLYVGVKKTFVVTLVGGALPGIVGADGGEVEGVVCVEMRGLAGGNQAAAHVGGGEVVAIHVVVFEKASDDEEREDEKHQKNATARFGCGKQVRCCFEIVWDRLNRHAFFPSGF